MIQDSTIFALSTPPGKAGIAIIRISGPDAGEALYALTGKELPEPRVASLRTLSIVSCQSSSNTSEHEAQSTEHLIDEAITLYFPAPCSFTGEDVIELHVHGSRAVVSSLLKVLGDMDGLCMAEPGEFSRRAFNNGKMDLTRLEGLADLIDAETKAQQKLALRQMSGELERLYESWRGQLITILAQLEAYIDFPDEDIPENTEHAVLEQVSTLLASIQSHLSNRRGEILREGVYAVIIGAPNVGKSSLLNHLAQRDVAIVSEIEGTTRDVLEVHLDIGGYPIILADTAGLRESTDIIESEGVKRALKRAEQADIRLCMFDAQTWPKKDTATEALIDDDSLILVNKTDIASITDDSVIPISVETGQGLDTLFSVLEEKLANKLTLSSDPVLTRERHRTNLSQAEKCLQRFLSGTDKGEALELRVENLRLAAQALGRITGKIDVEDILDQLFSSFCIGK